MAFPAITVIIPVRNGEATIAKCVSSVLLTDYPAEHRQVIVVDNASSDGTARIVRGMPVTFLEEPVLGPSSARNRGIAACDTRLMAFIDADCVATAGWLRALVAGFDAPDVGMVAGEILPFPPTTPAERYMAMRHPRWQEYALGIQRPYAVTANIAVRRETFDRIGTFDPVLTRGQDMDFGWRFFRDGSLKVRYAAKALVFHRHRATAATFFRQQMGWGRGRAMLHAKHGLPWSVRDELAQYARLAGASGQLLVAAGRYVTNGGDPTQIHYSYYEWLRCAAGRLGALSGFASRRTRASWQQPSGEQAS